MSNSTEIMSNSHSELSLSKTLLFAITGGIAVGNLYWAQPLLVNISETLNTSITLVGGLITATQLGYAFGILLIVPLGDTLNRKRLIPSVMLCSAIALLLCATATNFITLTLSLCCLGLTTISGQLITPLASEMAKPEQRGKIVGIIVSGMLTGILLSRSISGFIADVFGWRAIYFIASLLMLVLSVVIFRSIPQEAKRGNLSYPRLLRSVLSTVTKYKTAQVTLLLGATSFFVFSALWTGITFLLSVQPYSYSLSQIGMVGLVGLAGALVARKAGVLHDKGHSYPGLIIGLLLALLALVLCLFFSSSIAVLLLGILIFDIGIQMLNVLNQTRLLTIDPEARNRLNTAFVCCNFIGGALGSALAGALWERLGWNALILTCTAVILMAISITVRNQKHLINQ